MKIYDSIIFQWHFRKALWDWNTIVSFDKHENFYEDGFLCK